MSFINRIQQQQQKLFFSPLSQIASRSIIQLVCRRMMSKCKIGVCQVTSSDDKESNVKICKDLVVKAKESGARMVFLPESFDYIDGNKDASKEKAETLSGYVINTFKQLAKEQSVWLSLGGFHRQLIENNEKKMYNSHVIIDDTGEIRHVYNKIHLFEVYLKAQNTVMREADFTHHGQDFPLPVDTPVGSMGTLTCYDLRFPQQSTLLRKLGASVLTYPSGFTKVTGEAHWHTLLRARAIENQCYVIAAAQSGKHSEKRTSYGHSLVVDPWGKVILDMEEKTPHVEVIEIDLDYVNEVRTNMPVINSYRDDLYTLVPAVKKPIDQPYYTFGHIQLHNSVVFYESQHSVAVVNIKPIVKGHTMVIPKTRRNRVYDMTQDEIVDLFCTARLIATKLEQYLNGTSMNYAIQDGPDAGQSVHHVHLHVLPRRKNDFERNDDIYEHLRHHDQDMKTGLRTLEAMSAEASEFRKLFGYEN